MLAGAFALALAVCAGLNSLALRASAPARVAASGIALEPETAVQSAALLGLGMRRLAADLEFVRLLVYYGTTETGDEEAELATGGGHYPEVGPRGRRIAELDPTFSYAVQYAAGALAFNLHRPDQALELLRYALSQDPDNLQYRQYIGAVGFSKEGDIRKVVELLEPMLGRADCPAMIKSMVAFMYQRLGRTRDAIKLYLDIAENSKDPGYRAIARTQLEKLAAEAPGRKP